MDRLTNADCVKIMQHCITNNFVIIDYKVSRLSENVVGFLAEHLCLTITVKDQLFENAHAQKQYKFFVKALPSKMPTFLKYINDVGFFKKELLLFSDVFPKLEAGSKPWTARCYLTKPSGVIVLEDLAIKGYTMYDSRSFFDYKHAESAVKTFARFHACSMMYEEKTKSKLIDTYKQAFYEPTFVTDKTSPRHKHIEMLTRTIIALLKTLPDYTERYEINLIEAVERVRQQIAASDSFRKVATHGDCWTNNMMFKYVDEDTIECILIDFQCARYTVPVYDIIMLIHLTTSKAFRQKNLNKLLKVYHETINEELNRSGLGAKIIYPFGELLESYVVYKKAALLESIFFSMTVYLDSAVSKSVFESSDSFHEFIFKDKKRIEITMKAFTEDVVFRKRVVDVLDEVIECVLKR